jgi:3-oxoacyl-(acyl-carrier-protein) synthase
LKVFVTGIGIVSGIGQDVPSTLLSLKKGITGIKWSEKYKLMIAEVPLNNAQLVFNLGLDSDTYSRTSLLSIVAAKEAWDANSINLNIRTGLISATSVGGLDRTENYYNRIVKGELNLERNLIYENGQTTEEVAKYFGLSGFISTISTACSSGANAIMQGSRMLKANKLDRVLVGGCDPLANFDINGFNALGVYDENICKPFDENRNGLNLGEGAAFLVLENENSLKLTQNVPLCEISGWSNTTDAYHQTASSPTGEGATLAMKNALKMANLSSNDISYVNAHGKGTKNNDLSESAALQNIFGSAVPLFSSTKGFTGHTLAAAGALEAVFSILTISEQAIPPNLNFISPMQETGYAPVLSYLTDQEVNHVISNSFGFGGNCSSLIFSKIQ